MNFTDIQKKIIEMTQTRLFKIGFLNMKFKEIIKSVLDNDLYLTVHLLSDLIKFTDDNGLYRAEYLARANRELRELSALVSSDFMNHMELN